MNRRLFSKIALWTLLLASPIFARAADRPDEQRLISVLQSASSPHDKEAACSALKRIGTAQSVPALAALLTDERFSHSARYALESMQAPEAGAALLEALPRTSGLLEVGIINSLAVRKVKAAIAPLSKLLDDANNDVAVAASEALGRIGGVEALAALESAPPTSAAAANDARIDARLMIANDLLTQGNDGAARNAFQRIYDGQQNETVRVAAFRGLILSSGQDGIQLMSDGISGADTAPQSAALQLASTLKGEAVTKALTDLLAKTQPPVQIALLRCLAQRGDGAAFPAVASLVDSANFDVGAAAITALGDLGDGSVALLLARTAAERTGAARAAARQSLLDLHRGEVTAAMIDALSGADGKVRLELLWALGNRGDKAALPKLIEFAQVDDDAIRSASCQALALLADVPQIPDLIKLVIDAKDDGARLEAAEALNVVYQRVESQTGHADAAPLAAAAQSGSVDSRVSLLTVCAGLNEAPSREALRAAIKDSDSRVKEAAIRAVCDTHDTELLPDLIQLAHGPEDSKFRVLAIGGCVRLMTQEEKVDISIDDKLQTFKSILDSSLDAPARRMILSGLAVIPDERSLAMSLPLVDDSGVRREASRAVIQIAGAICGAHQEEASAALKKVLDAAPGPDVQKAANDVLHRIQEMASYVTAWEVAGPYEEAGKNYAALFDIAFPPEEGTGAAARWQTLPAATDPAQPWKMDLLKTLGGEQRVAYARTWIYSPNEVSGRLEMGSDDGAKVWLNGKLIHANNASRALQPGSDKVDVTLQKGWNPLLLKVTQNNQGWEFCVRFAGTDGAPITGLRASLTPSG